MARASQDKFYVVGENNNITPINTDEQIQRRYSIEEKDEDCNVVVEEFWFGEKGTISHESDFMNKHHPECNLVINSNKVP